MKSESELMTEQEVAALLRVSQRTVMRLRKAGKLRAIRIGRQLRYRPSALNSLLAQMDR